MRAFLLQALIDHFVLTVDRGDEGYSPVWHMYWVTLLPINYNANQFSHPNQLLMDGVTLAEMPVWINCP